MRIEVSIAKSTALPNGALEALNNELSRRIEQQFPAYPSQVTVRFAASNNLSVIGGLKEDKDRISEILQETWESADDWFDHDVS
ncbi:MULTISPECIES: DNA damage-inducible protein I [Raoultella]|jgi:DNA-damage-inducible protein I|uniref:DNA damage-inducible protein I n=1 Tax=Raoultella planticola TaxID=575 RepID=A0A443VM56_RAOPL|nr:DNA damage-inducible protein I [Raoultella planticola]MDU4424721.1 DNA damage-inducible protein I [Raoultella sp.]AUU05631.1 DNA damage-inducible protein I [Raoultella planticola]EIY2678476.1 DNA damage-inducible protein I [Raoultella planticola]EJR0221053.1 DNA damage-inducible protein I [Raoultella planticola]EJR0350698.1 DNA damage-inducible protein I [Raoultella planticola]